MPTCHLVREWEAIIFSSVGSRWYYSEGSPPHMYYDTDPLILIVKGYSAVTRRTKQEPIKRITHDYCNEINSNYIIRSSSVRG